MSSTNKTTNLNLNSWIGSDKPQMADFNSDNEIIDSVMTEHKDDSVIHITQEERESWNTFVQLGMYYGDGSSERTVELDCDFDVKAAVIFANSRPLAATRFSDSKNYNYSAILSREASTIGVAFGDDYKSFTVEQSSSAVINNEYANLNESGVTYNYILFR